MGRPRLMLGVDELPLVGGAPCLDFVNTTGARDSVEPRDRLLTYDDLLTWSGRTGILTEKDGKRLARLARARPREAAAALARAHRLREVLYRVLRPVAEGGTIEPNHVEALARWARADLGRRDLVLDGDAFRLRLRIADEELDPMLWPIVSSAVALLTSATRAKIKRCGECDWLFIDETKNGSRTWCKKQCGDRVRARRHYARR